MKGVVVEHFYSNDDKPQGRPFWHHEQDSCPLKAFPDWQPPEFYNKAAQLGLSLQCRIVATPIRTS